MSDTETTDAPETTEPITSDPLADLYIDGHAIAEAVPPNCPILRGGSEHESVPALITVLNRELGASLPVGRIVTSEVLQAVSQFNKRFGVPVEEFGFMTQEDTVGPNTWAAIKAYSDAHAA